MKTWIFIYKKKIIKIKIVLQPNICFQFLEQKGVPHN